DDQQSGDSFNVRVEDSDGDVSAVDVLTITVNDDGPTAVDDTVLAPVAEDGSVEINVFANDTAGADGVDLVNGITVTLPGAPSKGTLTYNNDGTFTYQANDGAEGNDSFTYQIVDGDGDVSEATVSLSIAADAQPEISAAGPVTIDEDGLVRGNR